MKSLVLIAALALAACSESTPPPAPAKPATPPQPQAAAPKIEPAPTPVAAIPEAPKPDPNKELAGKVRQALEAPGSKLPSGAIDVTAADGKVTLWGALPTEGARRRAAQVAGKVDGVKSVDNQLKVVRGS